MLAFLLKKVFIRLLQLLHLVDHLQVVELELIKELLDHSRILEVQLIFVVVGRDFDQVQLEQCVEGEIPVLRLHFLMVTQFLASFLRTVLLLILAAPIFAMEGENHALVLIHQLVGLEEHVMVKIRVRHVLTDPFLLDSLKLLLVVRLALIEELLGAKAQQKVSIGGEASERVFVLLDLAANLHDVLVQLLELLVLSGFLGFVALLFLLLLLLDLFVASDVGVEIHFVVFKLFLRVDEGLVATLLSFL